MKDEILSGTLDKKNMTVVVGLSGGVDSSVALMLLKNEGYNVVGLHMKNADTEAEIDDKKMLDFLSQKFGVEIKVVDYDDSMQKVKDYFEQEYALGRTPNPCVMCNKWVKFNPFIQFAEEIGADFYATGHYAIVEHEGDRSVLRKAVDESKDQSYFLNQLSQKQLSKALFPLGKLTKTEVKKIAEEAGLVMANRKESYDVCFLGNQKLGDYLGNDKNNQNGNIVDLKSGNVVGKHNGLSKFTIGQRKGLGIGGGHSESGEPWFVVKKDLTSNILFVSQDESDISATSLLSANFNWINGKPNNQIFDCKAKCRYRQKDQAATVQINQDESVKVEFKLPQRAITTGQYVVLYTDDGKLMGGGQIDEVF